MKNLWGILFLSFFLLAVNSMQAQGNTCATLEPFCAVGEELVFENANRDNGGLPQAEEGPDYGCLVTQPYPEWFYLQIKDGGNLSFTISQFQNRDGSGAQLDVDYIVWGPFDRGDSYCDPANLSTENIVDCSYNRNKVEEMDIPDASSGEVYIVMITNFEERAGFISLQQTNLNEPGSGTTDCSIVTGDLGEDQWVCGDSEVVLDAATQGAGTYKWYVFNSATGNYDQIPNESNSTLTVTNSGNYRVEVIDEFNNSTAEDDVNVYFYDTPVANKPKKLLICPGDAEAVDLTQKSAEIEQGNGPGEEYEVVFYESQEDVDNSLPIANPSAYPVSGNETVYGQVVGKESGCTSEAVKLKLELVKFPDDPLSEDTALCLNEDGSLQQAVEIGEDFGNSYKYQWTAGTEVISSNPVMSIDEVPQAQNYSLQITDTASGCVTNFSTAIKTFSAPSEVKVEFSGDAFSDAYTVTAEAMGEENSVFQYRLDEGKWQDSGNFTNVPAGEHTVSAREASGCGIATSEAFLLVGYPHFFTPNGDGYNDTWMISDNEYFKVERLYIFDRYGKLLKQLEPNGNGWDGTFNQKAMPADDYWFQLEYKDVETGRSEVFKANFSLKR